MVGCRCNSCRISWHIALYYFGGIFLGVFSDNSGRICCLGTTLWCRNPLSSPNMSTEGHLMKKRVVRYQCNSCRIPIHRFVVLAFIMDPWYHPYLITYLISSMHKKRAKKSRYDSELGAAENPCAVLIPWWMRQLKNVFCHFLFFNRPHVQCRN